MAAATNAYTLQTDLVAGQKQMVVKLWSEYSGLTVPTSPTLRYEQPTEENYDSLPGNLEISAMTVTFLDDYTVYLEGFWQKVAQGNMEIQFILNNEHYFWGVLYEPSAALEELSIVTNDFQREGQMKLISVIAKAKDVTLTSLETEALLHLDTRVGITYAVASAGALDTRFIKITDVLASILKLTFGQSFASSDISYPAVDLKFYDLAPAEETLANIYQYMDTWTGAARGDEFLWSVYGQNGFDAMVDICQSLLLIPRYWYDVANSRHKLELLCRGRSYSVSTFDVPFKSRYIREAYVPIQGFTSSRIQVGGTSTDKRYLLYGTTGTGDLPPANVPTISVDATFIVRQSEENWDGTSGSGNFAVFLYTEDSRVNECHWYNYQTSAYVDEDFFYVKYYYNRWGFSKCGYERTYSTIEATYGGTSSFANNYPMRTTSIFDGVSTRTFYAVKVSLDAFADISKIIWHQV